MSQSSLSSSQTSFSSQNEPKAGLTIRLKHIFLPSIPAILYFASGVLYLTGLRFTSPAILSTTMLAKLPMTAALHRIVFNRKRSWIAWIWLTVLCIGLVSLNLPWLDAAQHLIVGDLPGFYRTVTFQDTALPGTTIGACIGFAIAAVSAIASIFTEKLLKQDMQFWAAQFWLYFYGVVFGCLAFLLGVDNMGGAKPSLLVPEQSQFTANMVRAGVILLTGGTGIIVANILRRGDNIVKICGAAAAVASTLICQPFLFPTLWRNTVNPSTLISVGCILQATWAYNYHATKFMRKSPFSPSVAWSPAASGRRKSSVKLEDPLPEYDEEKETASMLISLICTVQSGLIEMPIHSQSAASNTRTVNSPSQTSTRLDGSNTQ